MRASRVKPFAIICWAGILILASCTPDNASTPVPTIDTEVSPSPAASVSLSHTPTPRPSDAASLAELITPTATNSPTPSETPTPSPTVTSRPTVTPTATPPMPAEEFLAIRYPQVEWMEAYLRNLPFEQFGRLVAADRYAFDVFGYEGFSPEADLIYQDVNGDADADLIVADELLVGVFLWSGNSYAPPYLIAFPKLKYQPGSHVELADWTNDGVPEILFDYRGDTGGTGIVYTSWTRYIIRCLADSCEVALELPLTYLTDDYNGGGMTLMNSAVSLDASVPGQTLIEQVWEGFSIYNFDFSPGFYPYALADNPIESLKVLSTTLDSYRWNGLQFQPLNSVVLSNAYVVDQDAQLEAAYNGDAASVQYQHNGRGDAMNDVCQLYVNEMMVGLPFGCKRNFTQVSWQNLIGDEEPELVIRALSGKLPYDNDGNHMDDIQCMHQRQIIYQWDGEQAIEIANIAGCVVRSNLFGVELVDYDGDGHLEILAASSWTSNVDCVPTSRLPCWYHFGYTTQVYRWDGFGFTYVAEIPNNTLP